MKKAAIAVLFFLLVVVMVTKSLVFGEGVFGESKKDQEAERIMQQVKKQVLAPLAYACVEMKTYSAEGDLERTFVFRRGYYYDGEKEKILIDFVFPPDRARTKYFLVEDSKNDREEEVVWLKSLRRDRRIGNANEGPLEGSQYFYYDLLEHIDEFEYVLVKRQGNFFSLRGEPAVKPKVYGGLFIKVEEVSPRVFIYREIIFFDKDKQPWKKESYFDFKNIWKVYYRPQKIVMEDLKKREKTVLKFKNWAVGPLTDKDSSIFQRSFLRKDDSLPCECKE